MASDFDVNAQERIVQAVNALFQYIKANPKAEKSKKQQLLQEDKILLLLSYKKIPRSNRGNTKVVKLPIPHSVFSDASICLFVKDDVLKKRNIDDDPVVHKYRELLASNGVKCVNEIVTLHQLRTEFKPFESRRHLCHSHDLFLTDLRIWKFLPQFIGKEFWKKKRLPVSVNFQAKNIAKEFDKALHKCYLYIDGRGSLSTVNAARVAHGVDKVVENVAEILKKLPDVVPGGWENIRGIYMKTADTISIPVYLSIDSANDIVLKKAEFADNVIEDEHPHHPNEMVKIYPDGKVKVSRKRKPDIEQDDDDEESSDEDTDFVELITKRRKVVTRKPGKKLIAKKSTGNGVRNKKSPKRTARKLTGKIKSKKSVAKTPKKSA